MAEPMLPPAPSTLPAGPSGLPLDADPASAADDPQQTLRQALIPLPMTLDELTEWRERVRLSEERITQRQDEWDALWRAYLPGSATKDEEAPKVPGHFRNVETKKGQIFVKNPQVLLEPMGRGLEEQQLPPEVDPATGMLQPPQTIRAADAILVRQAVTNMFLGPDYIDAESLADECLLDMQAYSGFSAAHVTYRSVSKTVNKPVMGPDPTYRPPPPVIGSLGLNAAPPPQVPQVNPFTQEPITQPIQVPIYECWEAEHIPSKKLLLDEKLKSSRIDKKSRWIGKIIYVPKRIAQRLYGLTDEEAEGAVDKDDRTFPDDKDSAVESVEKDMLRGQHIFLKAEYFTDETHPQAIYELILFDCVKEAPVVYRPYMDQTFDDQGQLTEDSVDCFPIIVGSLRYAIDSPFPKSDSAFTNTSIKHMNTHRQQMVTLRDAAIGQQLYDTGAILEDDITKMKNGVPGEKIGLKPGALQGGADKVLVNTAQVHSSPDDWRTAAMLKADVDEMIGITATQAGGGTDTVRSATEIQTQNLGTVGRNEKEKAVFIAFYLKIVRVLDTLIFRYATGNRYVSMVGPEGEKKLQIWNKTIGAGKYSYAIKIDSQLGNDIARDRQQELACYTALAADQLVNRAPILRSIAQKFGYDPTELVLDQAVVNAHEAARQMGVPMGQPPHGGPANKHLMEKSGKQPNAPGAAESGDNRQERNPRPGAPA